MTESGLLIFMGCIVLLCVVVVVAAVVSSVSGAAAAIVDDEDGEEQNIMTNLKLRRQYLRSFFCIDAPAETRRQIMGRIFFVVEYL